MSSQKTVMYSHGRLQTKRRGVDLEPGSPIVFPRIELL
jgi:hypothetical protein